MNTRTQLLAAIGDLKVAAALLRSANIRHATMIDTGRTYLNDLSFDSMAKQIVAQSLEAGAASLRHAERQSVATTLEDVKSRLQTLLPRLIKEIETMQTIVHEDEEALIPDTML